VCRLHRPTAAPTAVALTSPHLAVTAPRFLDDYKVVVVRERVFNPQLRRATVLVKLGIWCMNPAVAFTDLTSSAHSILLASGTLSPMGSFSSELGTLFPVRLEAPHVINVRQQVWVGAVAASPNGSWLDSRFRSAETLTYQDALGDTILRLMEVIPAGVLVFLPSYGLLAKVRTRS